MATQRARSTAGLPRLVELASQGATGETIRAAIWYGDLRGFTEISERLPRERVIQLLNGYFDCMTAPIDLHGGEVLEFIGDAVLAIFRVDENCTAEQACAAALTAAQAAVADMKEYNARRYSDGEPEPGFGIALHVGDVVYGNIGAARRLDFTVIGPAVNYANRLERVCREAAVPLVMSKDFSVEVPLRTRQLGRFALRSVAKP